MKLQAYIHQPLLRFQISTFLSAAWILWLWAQYGFNITLLNQLKIIAIKIRQSSSDKSTEYFRDEEVVIAKQYKQ